MKLYKKLEKLENVHFTEILPTANVICMHMKITAYCSTVGDVTDHDDELLKTLSQTMPLKDNYTMGNTRNKRPIIYYTRRNKNNKVKNKATVKIGDKLPNCNIP